ncbi:MAG: hypothetical protein LBG15_06450 [Dysgonamonadaceae bacterium]|jgi:uncharacterized protein (TIGR02145 family)|nr:hypothetical protein [Dysgonamonadaceae bacterium]
MKQKMIFLALTLWMLSAASVKSQVLIGGNENDDPHEGAVLDLSQSANLGLLLPQVFLTNVTTWQLEGSTGKEGMMIYNTNDDVPDGNGKDIYVWTRNSWRPIGPVTLKRFSLDKSLLFLDLDGKTGTITAQITGSDGKPFNDVTVTWSIEGSNTTGSSISPASGNSATVTSGNTVGSFTVRAIADGITQDCVVTVGECAGVMDVEGNAYYAAPFGSAGCWMTQNLRTKTYADGITALTLGSDVYPASKFYNYPSGIEQTFIAHPEYGLLYTWAAATNRATTSANETNSSSQQQYQGICPVDWHLPSDYEWNQLEEEIAQSAAGVYSTDGTVTWASEYNTSTGSRGTHGKKMKSTTTITGTATNGTSLSSSSGGFDALLMGYMGDSRVAGFGVYLVIWSSSSSDTPFAWRREMDYSGAHVGRTVSNKYNMFSVRCKKD